MGSFERIFLFSSPLRDVQSRFLELLILSLLPIRNGTPQDCIDDTNFTNFGPSSVYGDMGGHLAFYFKLNSK